ncbi:hypothetical protein GCM10010145_64790 [Streptomyces ruber]|uniref:CobW/HypB/UreG nucleotide-binding domain-containing protein n=2 Tax=Streptomyces TaxID=1883 RepID=A0A918BR45_9ACTN|nr:hypothetical protein GCM10010145_64790 [Streptomyces ruber]
MIVNDMSDVDIDAALVRGGRAALSRTEERLVEMTDGCVRCALRDDLLEEVDRFDTMVTVVDAANSLAELDSGDDLAERGPAPYEDDERTVSDLLVDQVEFADVLVLDKLDLAGPVARLVPALHGRVDARDVLETGRFDPERAQQAPGWGSWSSSVSACGGEPVCGPDLLPAGRRGAAARRGPLPRAGHRRGL